MRTMIKYALAFLCLSILSCGSKESKYVEIKEPENTKKIIETRCYKEGPEIDGDYIPGDELIDSATKAFYDADDNILLWIRDALSFTYEDGSKSYSMTINSYKYNQDGQLENVIQTAASRDSREFPETIKNAVIRANLSFNRNTYGDITEISGFGLVFDHDDNVIQTTQFEFDKNGKIIKEVYDSLKHYKVYKYFTLDNGYNVIQCDEYNEEYDVVDFNIKDFGIINSSTEVYDHGTKIKSIIQHFSFGVLDKITETTYQYNDDNKVIEKTENVASTSDIIWNGNTSAEVLAADCTITKYEYDNHGNCTEVREISVTPNLNRFHKVKIGNNYYFYGERDISHNLNPRKPFNPRTTLTKKYYYNEHGDWYKCHYVYPNSDYNVICIRNIEYK